MSAAYNRRVLRAACGGARPRALARRRRVDVRGRSVLDVGCGTGFWTEYYIARGAVYTGVDIARDQRATGWRERYPGRHVRCARDVADRRARRTVRHRQRVRRALSHHGRCALRGRTAPARRGGEARRAAAGDRRVHRRGAIAEHNNMRSLTRYRAVLDARPDYAGALRPTHVLLNRHLGFWRFLNRWPGVLLAADRALLSFGVGHDAADNKLLVAAGRPERDHATPGRPRRARPRLPRLLRVHRPAAAQPPRREHLGHLRLGQHAWCDSAASRRPTSGRWPGTDPARRFATSCTASTRRTARRCPTDLASQLSPIEDLAQCLGLPVIEKPGMEADDVMATLARLGAEAGHEVRAGDGRQGHAAGGQRARVSVLAPQARGDEYLPHGRRRACARSGAWARRASATCSR